MSNVAHPIPHPSCAAPVQTLFSAQVCQPVDRRCGHSELVAASWKLARAAEYLIREQMVGRGGTPANMQEAIAMLCAAGEQVLSAERRAEARHHVAGWMRGATSARAVLGRRCW